MAKRGLIVKWKSVVVQFLISIQHRTGGGKKSLEEEGAPQVDAMNFEREGNKRLSL